MSSIAPPKMARLHVSCAPTTFSRTRQRARYGLIALFGIYLAILSWTVLWKLEAPWVGHASERVFKAVPYAPTYFASANTVTEITLNIALFIPLGIYLRYLAPSWSGVRIMSVIIGTSVVFEGIQYLIAVGVSDTTDILNNSFGGLTGMLLFIGATRALRYRTESLLLRVMLIGTAGALLLISAYVLMTLLQPGGAPAQLPPPR